MWTLVRWRGLLSLLCLGSLQLIAPAMPQLHVSSVQRVDVEHSPAPATDAECLDDDSAERGEDVDERSRQPHEPGAGSVSLARASGTDAVRVRDEDRRLCRPPNRTA